MTQSRRNFLKKSLVVGAGCLATISSLLAPIIARATWPADNYARTGINSIWANLLAGHKPKKSDKITIKIPKVAENGAIVPITIYSEIENTQLISIIAEKNPVPLIAQFSFSPTMLKQVTTRIKLADTGDVIALVRANDDDYYSSRQQVRVVVGGCGD